MELLLLLAGFRGFVINAAVLVEKKKEKKKKKKLSSVSVVLVEFCSVFGRVFSWKRLRHLDV